MSYGVVVTTTAARDFLDEGDNFSGLGSHQMIRSGMGDAGQGVVVDTRLGCNYKLGLQLERSLVRVDSEILGKRIRAVLATSAKLDADEAVPSGVLIMVVRAMMWQGGGHSGLVMGLQSRGGREEGSGRSLGDGGQEARGLGGVQVC